MRNIFFPIIILILVLGISWLNFRLSVRWIPQFRLRQVRLAFWFLTALSCLIIAYSWWKRIIPFSIPSEGVHYIGYAAFFWVIGQFFFMLTLPVLYAAHKLITTLGVDENEPDEEPISSRRTFLINSLITLPSLAFGVSAAGVYIAETDLTVRRFSLSFPGLPSNLNGLRIAQISDTHIGPYFSLSKLDRLLAVVNKEKPDIVVITGDLLDDLELLEPAMERLSSFSSSISHGVYFCWGNHEYFRDISKIHAALKKTPIKVMDNTAFPAVSGETPLYIVGVDYPWANNKPAQQDKRRRFLSQALAATPAGAFNVLLSHHPDFIDDAFSAGIPLTLTGHTHGGQVILFGKPILPLSYRYMNGLYRHEKSFGYVSTGAGHWFPFRLGCPPEVAFFSLTTQ